MGLGKGNQSWVLIYWVSGKQSDIYTKMHGEAIKGPEREAVQRETKKPHSSLITNGSYICWFSWMLWMISSFTEDCCKIKIQVNLQKQKIQNFLQDGWNCGKRDTMESVIISSFILWHKHRIWNVCLCIMVKKVNIKSIAKVPINI